MSGLIKAIPTRYRGHHFRSRLEARWAVVLDHLGIKWDYEKEGYELHGRHRYLPDFWLSAEEVFLEIKGAGLTDADSLKAAQLACLSGHPVYVLTGNLSDYRITEFLGRPFLDEGAVAWLDRAEASMPDIVRRHISLSEVVGEHFAFGLNFAGDYANISHEFVWLDIDANSGRLALWEATEEPLGIDYYDRWGRPRTTGGVRQDEFSTFLRLAGRTTEFRALEIREPWDEQGPSKRFQDAINAGLSARFEHGESGAS